MSTKKQIQNVDWQERLQTLTSGNRGRRAAIAANGMTLVEDKSFVSADYDPLGKGNDMIISLDGFTHSIMAPTELYLEHDDNGVLTTVEVVDQNGEGCLVRFY